MVPKTLIERCCLNDSRAETELWILVKSAAQGPVRSMLRSRDYDITFVEDVMQEMVLIMAANNRRKLRAFRGESEGQFRAYLRTIAVRLAQDMMRKLERTRQLEIQLDEEWDNRPNINSSRAFTGVVEEVESRMSSLDRRRFRTILWVDGVHASRKDEVIESGQLSPRTIRRWRRDLYDKYFTERNG